MIHKYNSSLLLAFVELDITMMVVLSIVYNLLTKNRIRRGGISQDFLKSYEAYFSNFHENLVIHITHLVIYVSTSNLTVMYIH